MAYPATPDGKPTPAIITKTMLNIGNIPFIVVDSGVKIKPDIPLFSFNLRSGKNISDNIAMESEEVEKAYRYGLILGKQLSKSHDLVITWGKHSWWNYHCTWGYAFFRYRRRK